MHKFEINSAEFDNLYDTAVAQYDKNKAEYDIMYSDESLVPSYMQNFSDYLAALKVEEKVTLQIGSAFISKVKDSTNEINTNANGVMESISDAQNEITDLESTFTDLADDVLDDWVKYQDYVNDYANLIFYILTGLMMAFGVAGFICTFFYASFDKCQCLRIVLHFVWNFLALFTFILLLLGSVFGLLGTVGSDGVGVMEYAFNENLYDSDPIIIKGDALDYVYECIHGNGDLYTKLNLNESAKDVNDIYNLQKEFDSYSKEIDNLKPSFNTTIQQNQVYQSMESITQTHTTIKNELEDINNQLASSQSSHKDKWVDNENNCGTYTRKTMDNLGLTSVSSACFVLNDYYGKDISSGLKQRYDSSEVSDKIQKLIEYGNTNSKNLKFKKEENNDLDKASSDILSSIVNQRDIIRDIITPINDIYSSLVDDDGIETLMNCTFMGNNINIFFDQMDNGLSGHATSFAIATLFSACCAGLSNLFVLLVIHKFRKAPEPKKPEVKPTEENESFKPEQKPTEEPPAVITQPADFNETEHPINPADVKIEMTDLA